MNDTIYDLSLNRIDGTPTTLRDFAGDVMLIVNVASACGLTPQYESLERAFEAERERGLVILGFPSNQFGAQEPGTNEEIATFCSTKFGVSFPMFEKIEVNGPGRHPLYKELIAAAPEAKSESDGFREKIARFAGPQADPTDVLWNFEKFLIARDGRVVARFSPNVTVDSPLLSAAIAEELGAAVPS